MKTNHKFLLQLLFAIVCITIGSIKLIGQTTPDPGIAGSYTVIKAEYNLGDLAYKPPSFPDSVEVRGSVFYPSLLSSGPFPVLFFLHGRHETCFETSNPSNTSLTWPCPTGWESITSYEGYDYLARNMASHGYIVISISCNAINATDNSVADYGMQGRAELLQHHIDLWNIWNTSNVAPFDSLFNGKLDLQNIGTMGHSRGGEGVVFQALYNQSLGSPYGIKAVLTLAPVDFERHVLHHIPLMDVSPYCDGDVSNLQGVHFYDDSRYTDTTDDAPKHTVLFMGANHNFFNTVWTPGSYIAGGADDWYYTGGPFDQQCGPFYPGNKRFDTTKQKNALLAYSAAFYRVYIGHETVYSPILTVDDIVPPASSTLDSTNVFVSYHPSSINRLDINRTDSTNKTTINTLQDSVLTNLYEVYDICNGGLAMASCGIASSSNQEPHKGNSSTIGLAQMNLLWGDTASYLEHNIPSLYKNISAYQDILFRATVNFSLYTSSSDLDFTVQLIDSAGDVGSVVVSNYTHALFQQPGTQSGDLPKILFNTIHIPINDFTGVDITTIKKVRFLFNKATTGSILISDLALSSAVCSNFSALFASVIDTGYKVFFNDNSFTTLGDSLSWYWNFGDVASGVNDTSTLQNAVHIYPGEGVYNPCLYVKSYKKNSFVCYDTFCQTITLVPPLSIENQVVSNITILPNPAKNYLQILGADKSAIFTLYNLFGQIVLSATLNTTIINLPANIANGIYYAVVTSNNESDRVFKKIFINK